MAELDPDVVLQALRKKAQERQLNQRLAVPEFEKDQLRVDQKVKDDTGILSGLHFPNQDERNAMGRSVMEQLDKAGVTSTLKKVDAFGRVLGNPFGLGDALESAMTGKTLPESRAQTAAAKTELGPLGSATELTGEIGAAIATAPVTTTVAGAALAGGVTNVIADTMSKAFKEDRMPTLEEAMISAGLGTGIGALGQVIGNKLARLFVDKGAAKTPITMGAERSLKNVTKQLSRAFQFADDVGATVKAPALNKFAADLMNNRKFIEMGLDPNVDKGAWNGLNALRAQIGRLKPEEGMTLRELATLRTTMRDVAARGTTRDSLMFDMDREFSKMIMKELGQANPKAKLAWQMLDRVELQKIQGEFLTNLADKAELSAAGGKGPIDKFLQQQFFNLVETDAGRKLMVKLGFSPEQKELFREAAHGTNATILANKADRVMGSTWLAPFYRLSLQPLLRARGASTSEGNILETLGTSLGTQANDMVPPLISGSGQVSAPISTQLADPAQNALLSQPPAAPAVAPPAAPAQSTAPAPNTGPQRMPRPFTPQTRSAVPNLPKP